MPLLWLASALRAAGLPVVEQAGWTDRGADTYGPVRGIIVHETRGSATSTDAGEIGVLINGREGLSGPIAQLYLSRTGVWHVIASGTCHHVKVGWGGVHEGYGNDALLGIEAAHAESEDWASKPAQYQSYVRGVAALAAYAGWDATRVGGHREHQPGEKPDPEFSMPAFRTAVAARLEDYAMTEVDLTDAAVTKVKEAIYRGDVDPAPGGGGEQMLWTTIHAIKRAALAAQVAAESAAADAAAVKVKANEVLDRLDTGGVVTDEQLERVLRAVLRSVPE